MDSQNTGPNRPEIIIVRRPRHDGHDDAHGGVWKVAFADFMTAMMAFFLVLWIVNASSKETRSSVARYFNPIQLSNTTPARKGLHDARDVDFDAHGSDTPSSSPTENKSQNPSIMEPKPENTRAPKDLIEPGIDESQRRTSNVALDRLKGRIDKNVPITPGDALYRDPFKDLQPLTANRSGAIHAINGSPPIPKINPVRARTSSPATKKNEITKVGKSPFRGGESIADEIAFSLKPYFEAKNHPRIEIEHTQKSVLINLMDQAEFSMFESGSHVLTENTKRIINIIASVVKGLPGTIVVRGHTDAAKFRSSAYGNWDLSLQRARAAQLVLLKSGLQEDRFEFISGHAERDPRKRSDRMAPQNRRIEILLKIPGLLNVSE